MVLDTGQTLQTEVASEETKAPLVFNDYNSFYNFVKQNNLSSLDNRIKGFVELIDKIPNLCGCVRNQVRDKARNMLGASLPLMQADNAAFFDKVKEVAKVSTIIFKEGELILLSV
jgi:hypothetical protein